MLKLKTVYVREAVRIGGKKSALELEPGVRSGAVELGEIDERKDGSVMVEVFPRPKERQAIKIPAANILNVLYDLVADEQPGA